MKSYKVLPILALLAVFAACQDMDVANVNAPDAERALAEPGDVSALLATGFYRFWNGTQKTSPGLSMGVAANEMTSSWGNFGMQDLGVQPRQPWDNSPTYGYRVAITNAWWNLYQGISNATDGMVAINQGLRFIEETGDETPRAEAYIRFSQGVNHGWLAMMYDQAIIFDETLDLAEGVPDPSPYQDVMAAAIGYLEEAIQVAEANAFQLPGGEDAWVNGRPLTNTELAQWAHAYAARYLAAVARTPAERAEVDWSRVVYHADRAGDGGTVEADGRYWWWAAGWYPHTWIRTAYDLLGPADESGGYEAWRALPPMDRNVFTIETSDRRIHGEAGPTSRGSYFRWRSSSPFPPDRGNYFQSLYENVRWEYHRQTGAMGDMHAYQKSEMDLLRAEAYLRAGNIPAAVDLINITRVGNGQMEPLPASISADEAWKWLKYEKLIEISFMVSGLAFAERRGWGDLICGTPLHFPIPGGELEQLEIPNYTFGGGVGGEATPPDCMP